MNSSAVLENKKLGVEVEIAWKMGNNQGFAMRKVMGEFSGMSGIRLALSLRRLTSPQTNWNKCP